MWSVSSGATSGATLEVFERHVLMFRCRTYSRRQTFFLAGRYDFDLNNAHTLARSFSLRGFQAKLRKSRVVRASFFSETSSPICKKKSASKSRALNSSRANDELTGFRPSRSREGSDSGVNVFIINDAESRQLADEPN